MNTITKLMFGYSTRVEGQDSLKLFFSPEQRDAEMKADPNAVLGSEIFQEFTFQTDPNMQGN